MQMRDFAGTTVQNSVIGFIIFENQKPMSVLVFFFTCSEPCLRPWFLIFFIFDNYVIKISNSKIKNIHYQFNIFDYINI